MRNRDRDELLGLLRQRAIGKDALTESPERGVNFGCQLPSLLGQLSSAVGIHVVRHCQGSFRSAYVVGRKKASNLIVDRKSFLYIAIM
jgi:hypothetical protein